jgi:hypothetical protein
MTMPMGLRSDPKESVDKVDSSRIVSISSRSSRVRVRPVSSETGFIEDMEDMHLDGKPDPPPSAVPLPVPFLAPQDP